MVRPLFVLILVLVGLQACGVKKSPMPLFAHPSSEPLASPTPGKEPSRR